jgi:hypothetical protein
MNMIVCTKRMGKQISPSCFAGFSRLPVCHQLQLVVSGNNNMIRYPNIN